MYPRNIVVAFGSCNRPNADQRYWNEITSKEPQQFIWTGDAVYTKNSSLSSLYEAFNLMNSNVQYISFISGLKNRNMDKNATVIHGI